MGHAGLGELPHRRKRHPALGYRPHSGDYVFRRAGQAWLVRFAGGRRFILLPSKGAAYLHILLSNPRESYPATELARLVASEPDRYALGDAGEATDHEALSAYRAWYEDLVKDLGLARKHGDRERETRIRREMDLLAQEIKRDQDFHGKLRKEADDRDRVRKAFRAAIRRVVAEIFRHDAAFAKHLGPPNLRCGWNPCYDPRRHVQWDTGI